MSDKALSEPSLTWGELELTQKMQRHFPAGRISPERIHHWSNGKMEDLSLRIEQAFQEPKFEVAPEYLPIWKRFRVGGLDKPQLRAKLKGAGRNVSEWGGTKFFYDGHWTISPEPKDVFFARVNLAFLGLKESPQTKDWLHEGFFSEWSKKHLQDGWVMELCQWEDGPSIGYQYTTQQPNGEVLLVISEPVIVKGRAVVWNVRRNDDSLWLSVDFADSAYGWALNNELLLRLRKVQASAA